MSEFVDASEIRSLAAGIERQQVMKVLQKLVRDSKWVKRERKARRAIDFRLDATEPGKIVDLPKAA